jgi:hypothetical protein
VAVLTDDLGQQGGVDAGRGADLQDPVARRGFEQFQHLGHRVRA